MEQNQKSNTVLIVILVLLILIIGALTYLLFGKESAVPAVETATSTISTTTTTDVITETISSTTTIIDLKAAKKTVPLSFELMNGYSAILLEGLEGGYGGTMYIGKDVQKGFSIYGGVVIQIQSYLYEEATKKGYTPEEWVDHIYQKEKNFPQTKYTTLFGHKAVSYINDIDNSPVTVGYVLLDEGGYVSKFAITVRGSVYGSGTVFNQNLYDLIIKTIKIQ